jgi:hypothetical protein
MEHRAIHVIPGIVVLIKKINKIKGMGEGWNFGRFHWQAAPQVVRALPEFGNDDAAAVDARAWCVIRWRLCAPTVLKLDPTKLERQAAGPLAINGFRARGFEWATMRRSVLSHRIPARLR